MTQVGSAAEEAVKLLEAAEQWARARAQLLQQSLHDSEHLATGAPACTACPLCQTVGALRQVPPETVTHLLDAAGSVLAAVRAAVAAPTTGAAAPDRPAPGVQHIRLDDPPAPPTTRDTEQHL